MKYLLSLVSLAALSTGVPQLQFSKDDANPRLGLLATNLGLSPTAETDARTGSLTEAEVLSGRVPGAPTVGAEANNVPVQNNNYGQVRSHLIPLL